MSTHKLGRILIVVGVIVIIISALVDWVGLGDQMIGSSQLAGMMAGLLVAVTGFSLAFSAVDTEGLEPMLEAVYGAVRDVKGGGA